MSDDFPVSIPARLGRPPHEPTDKHRETVRRMSANGIRQEDIARVVGISAETLRKYYDYELDTAEVEANLIVAESLFSMANSGNVGAAIFWLNTRGRGQWKEAAPDAATEAPKVIITGGLPTT